MEHKFEKCCKDYENIENYEKALADNFISWNCHHRLQTWTSDGKRRKVDVSVEELKALNMYFDRPAEELIFLPASEHTSLHKKGKTYFKGKHHSEETKKKQSEANKGEKNPMYGNTSWNKGIPMSNEQKKKISETQKGKPSSMKGKHHSEEAKKKLSEKSKGNTNTKGMHWYHNDNGNIMAKECPPGYGPGRLKK